MKLIPSVEVATCVQPVPLVLPTKSWFAVTEEIPVPPRPEASTPDQVEVNVCALPDEVMVRPMFVSDEVANVCEVATSPFKVVIPDPPPPVIQDPFTEIQPPVTAMPFAKVEVAVVLVMFSVFASTSPSASTVKTSVPAEFWILKSFAICPRIPRIEIPVLCVEVASTEITDVPNGLVVPNEDGVEDPLTDAATRAKGVALTR